MKTRRCYRPLKVQSLISPAFALGPPARVLLPVERAACVPTHGHGLRRRVDRHAVGVVGAVTRPKLPEPELLALGVEQRHKGVARAGPLLPGKRAVGVPGDRYGTCLGVDGDAADDVVAAGAELPEPEPDALAAVQRQKGIPPARARLPLERAQAPARARPAVAAHGERPGGQVEGHRLDLVRAAGSELESRRKAFFRRAVLLPGSHSGPRGRRHSQQKRAESLGTALSRARSRP